MATTKVRLAVATYHSSTFRNPKIENAGTKYKLLGLMAVLHIKKLQTQYQNIRMG